MSWAPEQLEAATAAAAMAIDGTPRPPAGPFTPEAEARIEWAIARAALITAHDASTPLARALAATLRIDEPHARDRLLLWGALQLRASGDTARVAEWAGAITDDDHRREIVAHDVRLYADAEQLDAARSALAALPAMWTLRVDVENWHGYPRWIGSTAAAAATALASARVAAAPGARELLEQAQAATLPVEDWRANREYRALALAWARVGDLDRAFQMTMRMPGSERASAIVELLDRFGDAPGLTATYLETIARTAAAATRDAPLVVASSVDRAPLSAMVDQVVLGDVVAALARRYAARDDLAGAQALVESLSDTLAVRQEAALQLACARLRRGELSLDEVVQSAAAHDRLRPNLVAAAADVGATDVALALVRGARQPERLATATIARAIRDGRFEDAATMLRGVAMTPYDRSEQHAALVSALARAGRVVDALTAWDAIPEHPAGIPERIALAAGFRLVVALVATGETSRAEDLHRLLAIRLRTRARTES